MKNDNLLTNTEKTTNSTTNILQDKPNINDPNTWKPKVIAYVLNPKFLPKKP